MDSVCGGSWERTAARLSIIEHVFDSADVNLRFQRIHQSLPGADPVSAALRPPPAALRLQAAPTPASPAPTPPASGSFPRDVLLFANSGQPRKRPFSFISGRGSTSFLPGSASGRAASRVKSKLSPSGWGKGTGAASRSRGRRGSRGTAFCREDAESRRGGAPSKVTRLAERTWRVRRLGSGRGPGGVWRAEWQSPRALATSPRLRLLC